MKRILVMEDDRIIGEMLKYMFTFKGYKTWRQQHQGEVASFILKNRIDLVLINNLLGAGENGFQICTGLKKTYPRRIYPSLLCLPFMN